MVRSLGQATARLVANCRDHLKCSLFVDIELLGEGDSRFPSVTPLGESLRFALSRENGKI